MASIFQFSDQPKVFDANTVAKLSDLSRATRMLRSMGCKIVGQRLGGPGEQTEVYVDRNPHMRINGCPSVHVSCPWRPQSRGGAK